MQKEEKNDLWIYLLLQSALLIFIESLKTYHFSIKGTLISLSIPILPFIFLTINKITKKYGIKKSLLSVLISTLLALLFIFLMSFAMKKQIDFAIYRGEILSYVISLIINIFLYKFLEKNTKRTYPVVFLSYIFSLIIFHMVYTLSYLDTTILDGYWIRYLLNITIEIIVCIPLTIIDKKLVK